MWADEDGGSVEGVHVQLVPPRNKGIPHNPGVGGGGVEKTVWEVASVEVGLYSGHLPNPRQPPRAGTELGSSCSSRPAVGGGDGDVVLAGGGDESVLEGVLGGIVDPGVGESEVGAGTEGCVEEDDSFGSVGAVVDAYHEVVGLTGEELLDSTESEPVRQGFVGGESVEVVVEGSGEVDVGSGGSGTPLNASPSGIFAVAEDLDCLVADDNVLEPSFVVGPVVGVVVVAVLEGGWDVAVLSREVEGTGAVVLRRSKVHASSAVLTRMIVARIVFWKRPLAKTSSAMRLKAHVRCWHTSPL